MRMALDNSGRVLIFPEARPTASHSIVSCYFVDLHLGTLGLLTQTQAHGHDAPTTAPQSDRMIQGQRTVWIGGRTLQVLTLASLSLRQDICWQETQAFLKPPLVNPFSTVCWVFVGSWGSYAVRRCFKNQPCLHLAHVQKHISTFFIIGAAKPGTAPALISKKLEFGSFISSPIFINVLEQSV